MCPEVVHVILNAICVIISRYHESYPYLGFPRVLCLPRYFRTPLRLCNCYCRLYDSSSYQPGGDYSYKRSTSVIQPRQSTGVLYNTQICTQKMIKECMYNYMLLLLFIIIIFIITIFSVLLRSGSPLFFLYTQQFYVYVINIINFVSSEI